MKIVQGFENTLSQRAYNKHIFTNSILDILQKNAYCLTETPVLEYYDDYTVATSLLSTKDMFKLSDSDGSILVLRPNMKNALEQIQAQTIKPSRFCYQSDSFRFNAEKRKNTFLGAAIYGAKPITAAAELISLLALVLRQTEIPAEIKVGHIDVLNGAILAAGFGNEQVQSVKANLTSRKNENLPEHLEKLCFLEGGFETLSEIANLTDSKVSVNASLELCELYYTLVESGLNDIIKFDFSASPYDAPDNLIISAYWGDDIILQGGVSSSRGWMEFDVDKLITAIFKNDRAESSTPNILIAAAEGITAQGAARKHAQSLTEKDFIVELIFDAEKNTAMQYAKHKNIENVIFINKQGKAEAADTQVDS